MRFGCKSTTRGLFCGSGNFPLPVGDEVVQEYFWSSSFFITALREVICTINILQITLGLSNGKAKRRHCRCFLDSPLYSHSEYLELSAKPQINCIIYYPNSIAFKTFQTL